ncbi:LOW QUALITY PROTEIN: pleiotropic regulator 1-like [Dugong dugon]
MPSSGLGDESDTDQAKRKQLVSGVVPYTQPPPPPPPTPDEYSSGKTWVPQGCSIPGTGHDTQLRPLLLMTIICDPMPGAIIAESKHGIRLTQTGSVIGSLLGLTDDVRKMTLIGAELSSRQELKKQKLKREGTQEAELLQPQKEVQKYSVHTLVFRSLKRTQDMFVADNGKPVPLDEESHKREMAIKLRNEYGPVLHMPSLTENFKEKGLQNSSDSYGHKQYPANQGQEVEYLVTGTHPYPSGPGVASTADTKIQRMPSESAAQPLTVALPSPQARVDANRTAPVGSEYHPGASDRSQPPVTTSVIMEAGNAKNSALMAKKAPTMPRPQWHPHWKLYRVISGHLGRVRCIAVEPGNQWFVTGSANRTIKIWYLASGKLKLSLTGHISIVRGVIVSTKSPYLFSCGEDKQVKYWALEYNKVIRHYHGHLSAVYGLDLHPTIDVLVTCSRDSTAWIWDIRTKASVHTLSGHTNAVATVRCQAAEPQIITGSHDTTILWVLVAGKTRVTLTNHKKSVRAVVLHPRHYTFASGSPDNTKLWKFPDGSFIQKLSGHNAIINTLTVNSGRVLVSGADNGTMHLWGWRTGYNFQRVHAAVQPGSLDSESGIFACAFDQSESRLLTAEADKTIKVYREDDTATEETHPVSWKPEIIKRKRF